MNPHSPISDGAVTRAVAHANLLCEVEALRARVAELEVDRLAVARALGVVYETDGHDTVAGPLKDRVEVATECGVAALEAVEYRAALREVGQLLGLHSDVAGTPAEVRGAVERLQAELEGVRAAAAYLHAECGDLECDVEWRDMTIANQKELLVCRRIGHAWDCTTDYYGESNVTTCKRCSVVHVDDAGSWGERDDPMIEARRDWRQISDYSKSAIREAVASLELAGSINIVAAARLYALLDAAEDEL